MAYYNRTYYSKATTSSQTSSSYNRPSTTPTSVHVSRAELSAPQPNTPISSPPPVANVNVPTVPTNTTTSTTSNEKQLDRGDVKMEETKESVQEVIKSTTDVKMEEKKEAPVQQTDVLQLMEKIIKNQEVLMNIVKQQEDNFAKLYELMKISPGPTPFVPEIAQIPIFYNEDVIDDFLPPVVQDITKRCGVSFDIGGKKSNLQKKTALYCINLATDRLEEFLSASRFAEVKQNFSQVILVSFRSGKVSAHFKEVQKMGSTCFTFYYFGNCLVDHPFNLDQLKTLATLLK